MRKRYLGGFAAAAGVADCIQILGYIAPNGLIPMQVAGIAAKILLVAAARRPNSLLIAIPGIALMLGLNLLSLALSPYWDDATLIQIVTFAVSLALTMAIIDRDGGVVQYARAAAIFIGATDVLYLALAATGRIATVFGRYIYFGDSSASLGAEIAGMGVIAACVSLRWRTLPFVIVPGIAVVVMTQGRAAMITSVLAIVIRASFEIKPLYRRYPVRTVIASALALPGLIIAFAPYIYSVFAAAMMLDDPQRGLGTGFVGRDERWQEGLKLFLDRPIFGNGPAAYAALHIDTPHNFYLYGLAQFGIMFAFMIAAFVWYAARAYRRMPGTTLILSSVLVLTVFNDRFANLAPYPFLMYVLLFGAAAAPTATEKGAELKRKLGVILSRSAARGRAQASAV